MALSAVSAKGEPGAWVSEITVAPAALARSLASTVSGVVPPSEALITTVDSPSQAGWSWLNSEAV